MIANVSVRSSSWPSTNTCKICEHSITKHVICTCDPSSETILNVSPRIGKRSGPVCRPDQGPSKEVQTGWLRCYARALGTRFCVFGDNLGNIGTTKHTLAVPLSSHLLLRGAVHPARGDHATACESESYHCAALTNNRCIRPEHRAEPISRAASTVPLSHRIIGGMLCYRYS